MTQQLTKTQSIVIGTVIILLTVLNVYQYAFITPVKSRLTVEQVTDLFHIISYNNPRTWPQNRWLGIEAQQNPNDVWIIQEILHDIKPDFVVETGTYHGGSAALWATMLEQINPKGRIISIDIADMAAEARKLPLVRRKMDFLIGSSTDPKIVEHVKKQVAGRKVVVILDSDHSKQHVLNEINAYASIIPVGSYLIVQDTNVNGHPVLPRFGPGPWEAVEEFLATNSQFQPDSTRERLLFTMHPRGYLKRIS